VTRAGAKHSSTAQINPTRFVADATQGIPQKGLTVRRKVDEYEPLEQGRADFLDKVAAVCVRERDAAGGV